MSAFQASNRVCEPQSPEGAQSPRAGCSPARKWPVIESLFKPKFVPEHATRRAAPFAMDAAFRPPPVAPLPRVSLPTGRSSIVVQTKIRSRTQTRRAAPFAMRCQPFRPPTWSANRKALKGRNPLGRGAALPVNPAGHRSLFKQKFGHVHRRDHAKGCTLRYEA